MSAPGFAGGCACGALRYEVSDSAGFVPYACHCRECQTRGGGACAVQLVVLETNLSVTGAALVGQVPKPDGAVVTHHGCAACLTRLYTRNSARPGIVTLRAGTRDDSSELIPAFHIWTASKQPWVMIPTDVPSYAGHVPDLPTWLRLLRPEA